jgi:peroxiredoxin
MRTALVTVLMILVVAVGISSQQLGLGTTVADFQVTDMNGRTLRYASLRGKTTVVIFFSTRCPMSNAFNYRRNQIYKDFVGRVNFIAADPNANEPLAEVREYARSADFDFPVYKDAGAVLADRFGAQVTTDTFVLDPSGMIRYHGYLEDSPNPTRAKIPGLRRAIEAVLEGRPVVMPEAKALGCSIRRDRL